ncbi:MAG TPA: SDR family NAD(P)-dependent oxidoreductase [Gillisia sp.]|nr:SDR family NAD(P)-dependent oxidoreductase [Gillisia sp.]
MFRDKIVWITGASSGIGREMAIQFAGMGAHVAVSARRKERLKDLVKEIEQLGQKALAVPCDVTIEEEVERAVEKIISHFGRLDIAVANSGFGVGGKIESLSADDWRRQLDVNVVGLTSTIKHSLPYLRKSGGRVVLMGSVAAMISSPHGAPYGASKAAVRAIGQVVSMELHGSGVSCTTIHPGFIESEIGQVDNNGVYRPEWQDKRPKDLMWPADKAVKQMLKGIKNRKREIIITGHGKVLGFAGKHFPGLIHWATVKKLLPSPN